MTQLAIWGGVVVVGHHHGDHGDEHSQNHDSSHEHAGHQDHDKSHGHGAGGHTHGVIASEITSSERGLWAVKWSFAGLMVTAVFQLVIAVVSGSVALYADTIHNLGDAATAIPLAIAFMLARRKPSARFPYGLGRVEDLAGMIIVGIILASAIVAGWEAIQRLVNPQPIEHLGWVAIAAVIGFLGNEAVAVFRIRIGTQIHSAALVADGYHARADGFTSLAVLGGAIGAWIGFPQADPLVGLVIAAVILKIVWDSAKAVFTRALDGVDPNDLDEIRHAASHTEGVTEIGDIRARWLGHRLHIEMSISVDRNTTVEAGHDVATETRHNILHHMPQVSNVVIHVDPDHQTGELHHAVEGHEHDSLGVHSHA